jgi:hypothetical protein
MSKQNIKLRANWEEQHKLQVNWTNKAKIIYLTELMQLSKHTIAECLFRVHDMQRWNRPPELNANS